ncbi:MAG: hypothetical protein JWQ69_5896, partial [Pseudomonas sp.]|nr:hypothetical protein [Pseudomonas sp.]
LVSGRRILQRFKPLSTTFFSPLPITSIETLSSLLTSANCLITKEFSVSSAPEVVRIIGPEKLTSRPNSTDLQQKPKRFYIEARASKLSNILPSFRFLSIIVTASGAYPFR